MIFNSSQLQRLLSDCTAHNAAREPIGASATAEKSAINASNITAVQPTQNNVSTAGSSNAAIDTFANPAPSSSVAYVAMDSSATTIVELTPGTTSASISTFANDAMNATTTPLAEPIPSSSSATGTSVEITTIDSTAAPDFASTPNNNTNQSSALTNAANISSAGTSVLVSEPTNNSAADSIQLNQAVATIVPANDSFAAMDSQPAFNANLAQLSRDYDNETFALLNYPQMRGDNSCPPVQPINLVAGSSSLANASSPVLIDPTQAISQSSTAQNVAVPFSDLPRSSNTSDGQAKKAARRWKKVKSAWRKRVDVQARKLAARDYQKRQKKLIEAAKRSLRRTPAGPGVLPSDQLRPTGEAIRDPTAPPVRKAKPARGGKNHSGASTKAAATRRVPSAPASTKGLRGRKLQRAIAQSADPLGIAPTGPERNNAGMAVYRPFIGGATAQTGPTTPILHQSMADTTNEHLTIIARLAAIAARQAAAAAQTVGSTGRLASTMATTSSASSSTGPLVSTIAVASSSSGAVHSSTTSTAAMADTDYQQRVADAALRIRQIADMRLPTLPPGQPMNKKSKAAKKRLDFKSTTYSGYLQRDYLIEGTSNELGQLRAPDAFYSALDTARVLFRRLSQDTILDIVEYVLSARQGLHRYSDYNGFRYTISLMRGEPMSDARKWIFGPDSALQETDYTEEQMLAWFICSFYLHDGRHIFKFMARALVSLHEDQLRGFLLRITNIAGLPVWVVDAARQMLSGYPQSPTISGVIWPDLLLEQPPAPPPTRRPSAQPPLLLVAPSLLQVAAPPTPQPVAQTPAPMPGPPPLHVATPPPTQTILAPAATDRSPLV